MSEKIDGGPAFPQVPESSVYVKGYGNTKIAGQFGGMTLRDYFAAQAMPMINQGLCWENIAEFAYQMADAMLAERAK